MENVLGDNDYPLGRGNDNHPTRLYLNEMIDNDAEEYRNADKCSSREYEGRMLRSRQEIISDTINKLADYVRYFKEKYGKLWLIVDVKKNIDKQKLVRNHISNKFNKLLKKQKHKNSAKNVNAENTKETLSISSSKLIDYNCSSLNKINNVKKENFVISNKAGKKTEHKKIAKDLNAKNTRKVSNTTSSMSIDLSLFSLDREVRSNNVKEEDNFSVPNKSIKSRNTSSNMSLDYSCSSLDRGNTISDDNVSMAEVSTSLETFSISTRASSQLSSQRSQGFGKLFDPKEEGRLIDNEGKATKLSNLCYSFLDSDKNTINRNRNYTPKMGGTTSLSESGCRRCPTYTGPFIYSG